MSTDGNVCGPSDVKRHFVRGCRTVLTADERLSFELGIHRSQRSERWRFAESSLAGGHKMRIGVPRGILGWPNGYRAYRPIDFLALKRYETFNEREPCGIRHPNVCERSPSVEGSDESPSGMKGPPTSSVCRQWSQLNVRTHLVGMASSWTRSMVRSLYASSSCRRLTVVSTIIFTGSTVYRHPYDV